MGDCKLKFKKQINFDTSKIFSVLRFFIHVCVTHYCVTALLATES